MRLRSLTLLLGPLALLGVLGLLAGTLLGLLTAGPASAGAWTVPLSGPLRVTRPFAPGPQPWSPGHRGADLAGSPGQPVLAAGAGRVTVAGTVAGRGVVVVEHGALRTTYEPVDALVAVGQPVRAGEPLGRLAAGHPGCPAAACLHWGLLRGDAYLDPLRLVRPADVRLLPVQVAGQQALAPAGSQAPAAGTGGAPAAAPPALVPTGRPGSDRASSGDPIGLADVDRPGTRRRAVGAVPVLGGLTLAVAAGARRRVLPR